MNVKKSCSMLCLFRNSDQRQSILSFCYRSSFSHSTLWVFMCAHYMSESPGEGGRLNKAAILLAAFLHFATREQSPDNNLLVGQKRFQVSMNTFQPNKGG